jgi:hypothetical protein
MKRLLSDIPQAYLLNEVMLTPLKRSHATPQLQQVNASLPGQGPMPSYLANLFPTEQGAACEGI